MSTQLSLKKFEEIYDETYKTTLKYILCKCSNIDDVNDLLQDTYIELYHILKRKQILELENCNNYIIGIAKNMIRKYYGLFYSLKMNSLYRELDGEEVLIEIPADINLEAETIKRLKAEEVWKFIKKKKAVVIKVFYLYYCLELKISQIAIELGIGESKVKNILYRTIQEIKKNIEMEGDEDD